MWCCRVGVDREGAPRVSLSLGEPKVRPRGAPNPRVDSFPSSHGLLETLTAEPEPVPALRPTDPVSRLRGVGPVVAERLARCGLRTIYDLLMWFPRRVRELEDLEQLRPDALGRWVRVAGRVESTSLRYLPRRRSIVTVRLCADDGTPFEVSLFNQPYLKNAFPAGSRRLAQGVLEQRGKKYTLGRGVLLSESAAPSGPCQLMYGDIDGVSEQRLSGWMRQALLGVDVSGWPGEDLPPQLSETFPDLREALRAMHLPADVAEHEAARRRFAVLEAVALFRRVEAARRKRAARQGVAVAVSGAVEERIERVLPFSWSDDQAAAVGAIRERLAGPSPMGVLLQGDVGTGKTAVAVYAALAVIAAGHQVAFLAPTELLAEQHHELITALLAGSAVRVLLLTSSLTAGERQEAEEQLRSGGAHLVVGTHALFSETTAFADLGLVVIDEQHRFGVDQRMQLVRKGADPHVLVMTATPIPRTLTLTMFGDLDALALRVKPTGGRPVPAVYLPPKAWPRILRTIGRHIARAGRVYVVCSRIGEEGEKGGAVRMHAELSRHFECGLVHGRMRADDRREVTAAFRAGGFPVLVGTTVLEVGVDVPDATLMVVVGADRLGLATLHQLRGRVGRGARRGLCILTGVQTPRTDAVCATTDGFELAEQDLRLRGAGELLGVRQSGIADLRALDPLEDLDILTRAREAVREEAIK